MKKGISIFILALLYIACKKDGGSGKQLYLSKVFVNDLLSEEYIYSSDMKAVRRNIYSTGLGQSSFAGFRLYEYEDGLMSRVLLYNKEGLLSDKKEISYDASKKITRIDRLGTDAEMDGYGMFQYENNQLSKIILYSPPPTKKTGEWQLAYNAQGNLVSLRRYYVSVGNLVFFDSAHFTDAGKALPTHWQLYEELLQEFPSDKTIESMQSSSYYYYLAGGPPTTSTHTFTQKTYNGQGYLTSQQYKMEANNGIGTTTTNTNLKYEYIQ